MRVILIVVLLMVSSTIVCAYDEDQILKVTYNNDYYGYSFAHSKIVANLSGLAATRRDSLMAAHWSMTVAGTFDQVKFLTADSPYII